MSPPPRRVTSHDVAARAGVSQPTVSLVLGGNPHARVAPATRERVLRAAEELGYRPNLVARGLVRRRSYSLGVVVPDLSNPFYADVVSGVERVAVRAGYATLLCDTRET
ncbi:MAG: LacI family DNA-binding transcriptional regulator, partial [Gemmatimonadetes bacterium]|nr:LacI family DNA-binding transcriptional regulator [Gemmatimonadota bacterium]